MAEKTWKWIYAYEEARKKGNSHLMAKKFADKTINKRKKTAPKRHPLYNMGMRF